MTSVQERTELRFTSKINGVPQQGRGHAQPIPGCKWLVQAAHQWGVCYLEALGEAQAEGFYSTADDGVVPLPRPVPATSVPLVQDAEKRRAYTRGYMLWYLCGRPKEPAKPGYAPGQKTDWWPLTVTDDNAEGSRREDLVKSPSDHCTMVLWAERAFYRYAEEEAATRSTSRAPSAAIIATSTAGSSSGAGKRPMAAEEQASPSRPRLSAPPPSLKPHESLQAFMKAFMKAPDARHAWKPGPFRDVQRRVAEAHQKNQVVGPFRDERDRLVIGEIVMPETDSTQTPGMQIYTALKDTYKIEELYDVTGKTLTRSETWPPEFARLELERVGEGGYNTVWQVKENASGVALRGLLPKVVAEALINRTHVLRVPKPSTWATSPDVALEMSNMMEASLAGFGPAVVAMWCGHTTEIMPGDGYAEAWFKLFMVIERGTTSVFNRLQDCKNGTTTDAQWKVYLLNLQRCIWWMSANRCVHLDSKPSNFVDTYDPGAIPSESPDSRLRIKVIDLDSNFYGRIERLTAAEATDASMQPSEAMGWKPCWLYNILVMSCNLRMYLTDDVYQRHWWSKIQAVVKNVTIAVLRDESPYPNDAEYARALRFLKHENAEWKGVFYWNMHPEGAPSGCKEAETLALIAVKNAKHYYHDEWWRQAKKKLVEPADAMRNAIAAVNTAQHEGAVAKERAALEAKRDQRMTDCRHAWKWYDDEFRSMAVPMIRFFEDEMALPKINYTKPKPLYLVLKTYAEMTTEDLAPYSYLPGRPPWRKFAQLTNGHDAQVHARWPFKPPLQYHYDWVHKEHWSRAQKLSGRQTEWAGSPYWSALRALGFGDLVAKGAQKS